MAGSAASVVAPGEAASRQHQGFGKVRSHHREIVQYSDHGPPFFMPLHELVQQRRRGGSVHRRERLVEQNHRGVLQDQAGEQRAPKLALRQFAHPAAQPLGKADGHRRLLRARPERRRGRAEGAEFSPAAERDELCNSQRKTAIDRGELRQEGEPALRPRRAGNGAAGEADGAGDRHQQRALAGAIGANHGGEAARREAALYALERGTCPVAHRYADELHTAFGVHALDIGQGWAGGN